MNIALFFSYFLIGMFGVLFGHAVFVNKKAKKRESSKLQELAQDIVEQKKEVRKEKILNYLDKKQKITNDDVEEMFGVSDSTAERYLNILEKQGLVKQVGETGRGVYYERME